MTRGEISLVERLRDELHEYHIDVQRLIQRCESCRAEVVQIASDMYGLPGSKETHPGLMGEVSELRRSKTLVVLALRGAWVLLTILFGAALAAIFQSP